MEDYKEVVVATRRLKVGKDYKHKGEQISNWRFFKRRNKNALLSLGWVVKLPAKLYSQLKEEDRLNQVLKNENRLQNEINSFIKKQEQEENEEQEEVDKREEGDE